MRINRKAKVKEAYNNRRGDIQKHFDDILEMVNLWLKINRKNGQQSIVN